MTLKSTVETSPPVTPLIEGRRVASHSQCGVQAVNPSNGRGLYEFGEGATSDVDDAVDAARRAFKLWERVAPSSRKTVLHNWADLITREKVELNRLDAEDMGKPISLAMADAKMAADLVRFYAECVDKVLGDVYSSDERSLVCNRRAPRGVIGAITPWNFPAVNAVRKLGPALAAGNAVVIKPSEQSPRSALRLAELALEAGMPPGAINVVPGLGSTVGEALALHSDVDMITFTGSTAVGKRMMQYAGLSNLKVVMAECGGKSPHIVFDDGVDLVAAAKSIASFLVTNQGQICTVGSRVLIERRAEVRLIEALSAEISRVTIGDALHPKTSFGPICSERQCARVMSYVEGASSEGAELAVGGRRVLPESGGYFVEPTIFRNVRPESRLAQEEVFGPVLAVIPFDTEEEAIRIANGTRYGLAAYAWTADLSRSMRLAKGVRSSLRVNAIAPVGEGAGHAYSSEPVGESGIGIELGIGGMESYMRRQGLWISHA